MSSRDTTFQPSMCELRQLAVHWSARIARAINRRERLHSRKQIAKLDDQLANAFRRLAEIKSMIGIAEYHSLCTLINTRLRKEPEHPLWWLIDDNGPGRPGLRLSRSKQGWIDVRRAAKDEAGIEPDELSDAIRGIN